MTATTEQDVEVNGGSLHVRVEGTVGKPWVVLIHSLGTDHRLWDPQIAMFAPTHRILRYDMRGHGLSAATPGPYDIALLTDDLLALIAHFQIARTAVVGISLGALTALSVALRPAPAVAAIAACDSRTDMSSDNARAIDERNRLVRAGGMQAVANALTERWLTPATIRRRPDIADGIRATVLRTPVEGFAACAEAVKSAGLEARLGEVARPALFVASDKDGGLPVEVMRGMQLRVPGSSFAVVPAASHLSNLEQPEIFNAILRQFLRDVP